jgi:hypothetical protein
MRICPPPLTAQRESILQENIGSLMLEREASGRRNRRPDERAVS